MKKIYIIVNPIAGRGAGEQSIPKIEQLCKEYNLQHDLVRTARPWHAVELAQKASQAGYEIVAAVGGDGTANEVLNGLVCARQEGSGESALGVISVGRGNDLAFGFGIPADLPAAVQALAKGNRTRVDIGRVVGGLFPQGRYFGNGVGIGFDAVVGFEALKMKRLHGFPSYLIAALKTIFLYYKAPEVLVEYENQTLKLSTLMLSVMNGRRMGGGFMMAPFASIDDSLLDLCIASQVSRAKIFTLIPRFMKGTQGSHPAIKTGQTRQITITALRGSLPAHADGETLCTDGDKLSMDILPRFLEIVR